MQYYLFAPACASAKAAAAPIPRDAPVISADLPANCLDILSFVSLRRANALTMYELCVEL